VDEARLRHLTEIVEPYAAQAGFEVAVVNGRETPPADGAYTYVAVMVPSAALAEQAVAMAAPGARINLFAGFAVGTRAQLDLNAIIERHVFLFGTSGSGIGDMEAVWHRLEAGRLDTNISVDAVCGMEGVVEALEAVEARSSGGKIIVYPQLHDLGMIRLSELPGRFPDVAARLRDGCWTREAEEALLAEAGTGSADPAQV
jgi:threonine dehydrogenase-like Zn-dependent dehydrogenase